MATASIRNRLPRRSIVFNQPLKPKGRGLRLEEDNESVTVKQKLDSVMKQHSHASERYVDSPLTCITDVNSAD